MSVHRHGSPQRKSGAWSPSPDHFARLMERIERANTSAAPERAGEFTSSVDRKNPPSFPGDAILVSLGIGRADGGDLSYNRGYYMAGFGRSIFTLSDTIGRG